MTSAKPYVPQPGTIAARVINWLRLQPSDYVCSTAVLAEELSVLAGNIQPSLVAAVRQGAVAMEKVNGLLYWSLGDGTPIQPAFDDQDEPLHPVPSIPKQPVSALPAPPVNSWVAEQAPEAAPVQRTETAPGTKPKRAARAAPRRHQQPVPDSALVASLAPVAPMPFAVGLQMHGGLMIECDGRRIELSDAQTRFLQRALRALEGVE